MLSHTIKGGDAEQVFMSVKNTGAVDMPPGHAVFLNNLQTAAAGNNDGYSVRFASTGTVENPTGAAGVVAGTTVFAGTYGSVQMWGLCDKVYVTAVSAGAMNGATGAQGAWTNADLSTIILRPAGAHGATTGCYTNFGYFGIQNQATNLNAATDGAAINFQALWQGGYAMPVGPLSGTATFTSSATCKAFLRFL